MLLYIKYSVQTRDCTQPKRKSPSWILNDDTIEVLQSQKFK